MEGLARNGVEAQAVACNPHFIGCIAEDQESSLVIEIVPKGNDFPFDRARLWVSKKDWVIIAMEWVERNGDTTLLRYSNIQLNTGLTDSAFEIHLSRDTKVTDVK